MESEDKKRPVVIVVFGVTGDLSRRYLLPALAKIEEAGKLPQASRIVGITRRNVDKSDVLKDCASLAEKFDLLKMDVVVSSEYTKLKSKLESLAASLGSNTQIIFHFAVPPNSSAAIIDHLGKAGLNGKNIKLLLEKPFGFNLSSAKEVIKETTKHFNEDQIYRIDHYLAKEMAQNITVFLSSNTLFRNIWNNRFIDHIEIIASEKIGIEGRSDFYEQTGALRDVTQSHLLQLAALILMEPCPDPFDFGDLPARRLAALKSLLPVAADKDVIRAQYDGYRADVDNPSSTTETFVSVKMNSKNERWEGVPVYLITGKNLVEKLTAICVHFKKSHKSEANLLMLRIQPNEGIEIDVWAKKPGYDHKIEKQKLQFSYGKDRDRLPDAYEQVLLEAIAGNQNLFASGQEIIESWRVLQPVLDKWVKDTNDLKFYKPGSRLNAVLAREDPDYETS